MCIKEVHGQMMLPHHVNSWQIPVDLGIVFWKYANFPETGTLPVPYSNPTTKLWSYYQTMILLPNYDPTTILWCYYHTLILLPYSDPTTILWCNYHTLILLPYSDPTTILLSYYHTPIILPYTDPRTSPVMPNIINQIKSNQIKSNQISRDVILPPYLKFKMTVLNQKWKFHYNGQPTLGQSPNQSQIPTHYSKCIKYLWIFFRFAQCPCSRLLSSKLNLII